MGNSPLTLRKGSMHGDRIGPDHLWGDASPQRFTPGPTAAPAGEGAAGRRRRGLERWAGGRGRRDESVRGAERAPCSMHKQCALAAGWRRLARCSRGRENTHKGPPAVCLKVASRGDGPDFVPIAGGRPAGAPRVSAGQPGPPHSAALSTHQPALPSHIAGAAGGQVNPPLMQAAFNGNVNLLTGLLEGGPPEMRLSERASYGGIALHAAACQGHEACVKALLDQHAEAQVKAAGQLGVIPLQVAAFRGHSAVVELLLHHSPSIQVAAATTTGSYNSA